MSADHNGDGPTSIARDIHNKKLQDLSLLFLHIIAEKQMPLSPADFNKRLPHLVKKTGMGEMRLIQLYRFATEESQVLAFNEPRRTLLTKVKGFLNIP